MEIMLNKMTDQEKTEFYKEKILAWGKKHGGVFSIPYCLRKKEDSELHETWVTFLTENAPRIVKTRQMEFTPRALKELQKTNKIKKLPSSTSFRKYALV